MLFDVRFYEFNQSVSFLEDGFIKFWCTWLTRSRYLTANICALTLIELRYLVLWYVHCSLALRSITARSGHRSFKLLVTGLGILTALRHLISAASPIVNLYSHGNIGAWTSIFWARLLLPLSVQTWQIFPMLLRCLLNSIRLLEGCLYLSLSWVLSHHALLLVDIVLWRGSFLTSCWARHPSRLSQIVCALHLPWRVGIAYGGNHDILHILIDRQIDSWPRYLNLLNLLLLRI